MKGGEGKDIFHYVIHFNGEIDKIQDFIHNIDKIEIDKGFGATNINQFSYDSGTGALSFNGSQFATLNPDSGFDVATDITLV